MRPLVDAEGFVEFDEAPHAPTRSASQADQIAEAEGPLAAAVGHLWSALDLMYGAGLFRPVMPPQQDGLKPGAAALGKAGFNPDEPRVSAGNPGGGQWTGDGGTAGSSSRHIPDAAAGGSESPRPDGLRIWERFPNPDFRNKLAIAENTADKPNFGYREVNRRSGALGRYQMTPDALRASGMIDAQGNWTGKYGIHSEQQLLANPEAQEKTLTDLLNDTERQLNANGAFKYIGTQIDGRVAPFTVTEAGLVAAGHREGARETRSYLTTLEENAFSSARANLTEHDLHVETRLRTFADVSYK